LGQSGQSGFRGVWKFERRCVSFLTGGREFAVPRCAYFGQKRRGRLVRRLDRTIAMLLGARVAGYSILL